MTIEALQFISDSLKLLGIHYEFGEWSSDIVYPYFVGEYQESPPMNEDGMQETTFLLTGFSRESWLQLEREKEKIENHFSKVGGTTVITASGAAVAIFYANSLIIPTGDAELKKIQINLTIKEWKVN